MPLFNKYLEFVFDELWDYSVGLGYLVVLVTLPFALVLLVPIDLIGFIIYKIKGN
jgi:hypothetical protein